MLFFAPVSCFALAAAEIDRRKETAQAREIELCATHRSPNGRYGREILWHPDFAADCVAIVSDLPLSEVTAWLASELPGYANEGTPLDLTDYCYLADVLREGLASPITSLSRARLERALLWVEQTGADIIKPRPAPASTTAEPTPAPALTPYTADEATKAVLASASRDAMLDLWPRLQAYEGQEEFDLAVAASKVRWTAPVYSTPEQAEREVASRAQRDFAHKLLASGKNDGFRLEALHQLADVGLSWAKCSRLVDTAKANVDRAEGPVQYATVAQREEIIRLLNHPLITRQEKTKQLLNINRLNEEKATQAIAKLRKNIEDREGTQAQAA